jgi:hypothetical protein
MSYDGHQITAPLVRCVACGRAYYVTRLTTPEGWTCRDCKGKP